MVRVVGISTVNSTGSKASKVRKVRYRVLACVLFQPRKRKKGARVSHSTGNKYHTYIHMESRFHKMDLKETHES